MDSAARYIETHHPNFRIYRGSPKGCAGRPKPINAKVTGSPVLDAKNGSHSYRWVQSTGQIHSISAIGLPDSKAPSSLHRITSLRTGTTAVTATSTRPRVRCYNTTIRRTNQLHQRTGGKIWIWIRRRQRDTLPSIQSQRRCDQIAQQLRLSGL